MKPRITLRGVGLAVLAWIAYSFLATIPLMMSAPIPFYYALIGEFAQSLILGTMSIIPWLITINWMDGKRWTWIIPVHALFAPLYAVSAFRIYLSYLQMVTPEGSRAVMAMYQWMVFSYMTTYILQFAVYHGVQITSRLRRKEKEALELAVLAREQELAALKSQINPHFLFNTLNSISAMVSQNAEETRTMLAELGDLFRYATEASSMDLVPFARELEFTKSYLNLESKRLGDRLLVEYDVASGATECLIPPLILQPLVENAIKHGVEPNESPTRLSITVGVTDGKLEAQVKDTGRGAAKITRSNGTGVGLRNTDRRLRKMFGDEAGLRIATAEGGGFEVAFSIPADPGGRT